MDEWNTKHHNESGLVDRVRNEGVELRQLNNKPLISKAMGQLQGSTTCGNSIWNDRKFLEKEMNEVSRYLNYRMVDVSTIKELEEDGIPA